MDTTSSRTASIANSSRSVSGSQVLVLDVAEPEQLFRGYSSTVRHAIHKFNFRLCHRVRSGLFNNLHQTVGLRSPIICRSACVVSEGMVGHASPLSLASGFPPRQGFRQEQPNQLAPGTALLRFLQAVNAVHQLTVYSNRYRDTVLVVVFHRLLHSGDCENHVGRLVNRLS